MKEEANIIKLTQIHKKFCEDKNSDFSIDQLEPLEPLIGLELDDIVSLYETLSKSTFCGLIKLFIETCKKNTDDDFIYNLAFQVFQKLPSNPVNNYFKQNFFKQNVEGRCTTLKKIIQKFSTTEQPNTLWKEIIENDDVKLLEKNPNLFLTENSEPKKLPTWLLKQIATNEDSTGELFKFLVSRGVVEKEQVDELFWEIVNYITDIDDDDIYDRYLSTPLTNANLLLDEFGIEGVIDLTNKEQNTILTQALELNAPLVALFFLNNYEIDKKNVKKSGYNFVESIFDQEIPISHIKSAETKYSELFEKLSREGVNLKEKLDFYFDNDQYDRLDPILTKIFIQIREPSKNQLSTILDNVSKNKEWLIREFGEAPYYNLEEFILLKIGEEDMARMALVDFSSSKNSSQSKLQSLALLHKKICDKIAIDELGSVSEPSRIRALFPNSNFEKFVGREYVKNVSQLCSLLSAGIFCNDLENMFGFSLEKIKVVVSSLYPENRVQFENANSKSELCTLIAQSMDGSVERKIKRKLKNRSESSPKRRK